MHYDISYKKLSTAEADTKAIEDIREYLSDPDKFEALLQLANDGHITMLNFAFGIIGVRGFPFHAFARRYCLAQYREWLASEPDPIATNDQGYPL